jgi:hypothetical protein
MLMLLAALALAADLPAPDAPPAPGAEAAFGKSPTETIAEAIALRRSGDVDGARALLVALEAQVPAESLAWYLYQRGICEELDAAPDAARAFYERVIDLGGDVALDAHFRRALVLEDLGLDDAALQEVLALDRVRGLSADDELTLALQRGISELNTGKRARGIKRIQAALDATESGDTHRYLRAKARYHLARALLEEADALALQGPEKRVVKRIEGRATRIKAAEQQIIALTALQEPEWVLASLISLGDSYGNLAAALVASTPPKRLDAAQLPIYAAEIAKKAQNVRTKSFHAYDQGVALATRLAWESARVAVLTERRAAFGDSL